MEPWRRSERDEMNNFLKIGSWIVDLKSKAIGSGINPIAEKRIPKKKN